MKVLSLLKPSVRILLYIFALSTCTVIGASNTTFAKKSENYNKQVCDNAKSDNVGCLSRVKTDKSGTVTTNALPSGLNPTQFRTAYNLPSTSSNPGTIAIVAAYNHPNIKSDLDTYNSTFGLPAFPSCSKTITKSCFQKVNQRGSTTSFPATNAGWALEIAMDVEVAHQACPSCKLILVEANDTSYTNMMAAVDQAVRLGAKVVSNSWGGSEFSGETTYDSHFNKPGVAFTFSSGDSGFGTLYPAASKYVTAVGGTTLTLNSDGTRLSETAWSGAGSGCSLYETKPTFQKDTGCAKRTIADVSAVADPITGAAVYSSVVYQNQSGWFTVGGTSLSAPIIAGIYGLANNVPSTIMANTLPYKATSANLFDVTSGANGTCSTTTPYLCNGLVGYDGPTGLGSPNGIGAF